MMLPWSKLVVGSLLIAGLAWLVHEIRADGARSITNAIERQNNDAESRAREKRLDYDSCLDVGRLWDFASGQCSGTARRGRN
ncbi:hypothetical protein BC374_25865 [Ensifer sp. LC13]|nr:hypothetical protein BC362_27220 [Ensifer sp. LC14]OCP04748.1 hypothetical protein BC374_25865 [Ensifer sp. LC13]OCP30572.1 hypothetical protein BC364_25880 [Ensifer sp. LC499]